MSWIPGQPDPSPSAERANPETSDENHWQRASDAGVRGRADRDQFGTTSSPLNEVHHFASCLPARFQLTFKTTVCYSP
jgi:hypothetical protein